MVLDSTGKALPIFGLGVERVPFSNTRCFACIAILCEQPNFFIIFLRDQLSGNIVKILSFSLSAYCISVFFD